MPSNQTGRFIMLLLVRTALLLCALASCRGVERSSPDKEQAASVGRIRDSLDAIIRGFPTREAAFWAPLSTNRPALVLFAPRPGVLDRLIPPAWLSISALRDSLSSVADSLGIPVELRDVRHLAFGPDRAMILPALPSTGYFFMPVGAPLAIHPFVPSAGALIKQLRAYRAAQELPTVPRAT